MSQNKTYIHYPSDRLIEGKLWPHRIEMPEEKYFYSEEGQFIYDIEYEKAVKLTLASSIPFEKTNVNYECYKSVATPSSDWMEWRPDPEKIYEIEGIETYKKYTHFHEECRIECICNTDDVGHITIAIKQAKEELQESQEKLWRELLDELHYIEPFYSALEKRFESKFHIQRK